jgi:predicted aminopeptidase
MRLLKKILKYLFLLLLILIIWNIRLISYGIDQLKGQLHIVMRAKPIEQVLKHPKLKPDYKRKLLLIAEIKKFAIDSLGLKNSDNYTTFYDQHNKPALWVLTACEPFSLNAYQWHFPFLGNVAYKGFFIRQKGEKELHKLKSRGYDTDYSPTGGWSTLGWFKDPVLSNFLKRSDGRMAETIIHELTHTTIYLKSSVDYNENLATFVGEKGAEKFLAYKYGAGSKELEDYRHHKADEELYGKILLEGTRDLENFYNIIQMQKSSSLKEDNVYSNNDMIYMKYYIITQIMLKINRQPFFRKDIYYFDFKKEKLPNNTYFLSNSRYRKKQDDFEKEFNEKCNHDLKTFVRSVIQRY